MIGTPHHTAASAASNVNRRFHSRSAETSDAPALRISSSVSRSGSALAYGGKSFIKGYVAVPAKMKKRAVKTTVDRMTRAPCGRSTARRACWTGCSTARTDT